MWWKHAGLLLLFSLTSICGLVVHFNGTTEEVPAVFTTISTYPDIATKAPFALFYKSDLRGCEFVNSTFILQHVAQRIVVFADYVFGTDLLQDCVSDPFANGVMIQKILKNAGAIAVITEMSSYETNYHSGRIAGFRSKHEIPFLVTKKKQIKYLVDNEAQILFLEIPPTTTEDKDTLQYIKRTFNGMIIADSTLYFIVVVVFGYLLGVDAFVYYKDNHPNKRIPPGLLVKGVLVLSTISGLLWLLIDPCSYRLNKKFPSLSFLYLHVGTTYIICYFILGIWAQVMVKIKDLKYTKIVPYVINTLTIVMSISIILMMIVVNVLDAAPWYLAFRVISVLTIIVCEIGYIYYGVSIVRVLRGVNKISNTGLALPIRISVFIFIFVLVATVATCVFLSGALGGVLGELFYEFFIAFGFISVGIILFFNGKKRLTPTNTDGTPKSFPSST